MGVSVMRVKTPGGTLACYIWGDRRKARRTWVLLHALGSSGIQWSNIAPLLAEDSLVICPDLPGHGLSDPSQRGYAMATLGESIVHMFQALEAPSPVVVGNSLGASIALAVAHQSPELIAGAVLIDGALNHPRALGFSDVQTWMAGFGRTESWPSFSSFETEVLETAPDRFRLSGPHIDALMLSTVGVTEDGRVVEVLQEETMRGLCEGMWEEESAALFPELTTPMLVAICEFPSSLPMPDDLRERVFRAKVEGADLLKQHVKLATSVILEQTHHLANLHRPDLLHETLCAWANQVLDPHP